MNEYTETLLDKNTENLPEEVKDFIFGEDFAKTKNELQKIVQDETSTQKLILSSAFYVLGIESPEILEKTVESLPFDENKKNEVKVFIKERVFEELLLLTEVHKEIENDIEAQKTVSNKEPEVSNTPSLVNLSTRLAGAAPIAPVTRDYSIEKPAETNTPLQRQNDPYHEPIEK